VQDADHAGRSLVGGSVEAQAVSQVAGGRVWGDMPLIDPRVTTSWDPVRVAAARSASVNVRHRR